MFGFVSLVCVKYSCQFVLCNVRLGEASVLFTYFFLSFFVYFHSLFTFCVPSFTW